MKQKSKTTKITKNFVTKMEDQNNKTPAAFRTDNGGDYISNDIKEFFI
jgi:hypothetical protein